MKKIILYLLFLVSFFWPNFSVLAEQITPAPTPPIRAYSCPKELEQVYNQRGEICTTDYNEFLKDPFKTHFWTDDQEVTIAGRASERARQFIYWVLSHPSIDNHPTLLKIWATVRNLNYFLIILVAAFLGLGIIIGQKTSFETGIKVAPSITKIFISILYITFSATIVLSIIQLSEILMKFFIENLGGKNLFNTYFNGVSQESNYYTFYGLKDLNYGAQEWVKNQLFFLKLTEITYYILGGVFILRKIVLWFLLFASPFLAILFAFSFSKNIGWIWIGVFFQWVFYGPLLALFLGGLAAIWQNGIPFIFDFSRAGTVEGNIFPMATNILWGGPAQKLSWLNNVNYIDTFAEYIITLIMLWVVIVLPWWLLRTFRDYCCDGINAIKNILLTDFGPGKTPPLTPSLTPNISMQTSTSLKNETVVKTRIETIEEIKKAKTEEITHSLDIKANNLADIARFETNKQAAQNLQYLKNPTQAATASDRQKYMNIRVELSNRAAKSDPLANRIITSIFSPPQQQIKIKSVILNTLPKTPIKQVVSYQVKLPEEKIKSVSNTLINYISNNNQLVSQVSQKTNVDEEKVKQTINLVHQSLDVTPTQVIEKIAQEAKLDKEKVAQVVKEYAHFIKSDEKLTKEVAEKENIKPEEVKNLIDIQTPLITEPEKNIEQAVIIPKTVSIDEYEQVKKMWQNQYEKGEIPVNENIRTRGEWVEKDIVFITNTLNKLLSDNQELKQQGLDEVGYILPIFMINNLNGEQLVTYLKAKLEAAKTVKALFDKEKEITEKLKAQAEKVEVSVARKKEEAKTMEMSKNKN
ncbi:MAG: hypothetical protein ACPLRN_01150 [Microgenomates group bacterium]